MEVSSAPYFLSCLRKCGELGQEALIKSFNEETERRVIIDGTNLLAFNGEDQQTCNPFNYCNVIECGRYYARRGAHVRIFLKVSKSALTVEVYCPCKTKSCEKCLTARMRVGTYFSHNVNAKHICYEEYPARDRMRRVRYYLGFWHITMGTGIYEAENQTEFGEYLMSNPDTLAYYFEGLTARSDSDYHYPPPAARWFVRNDQGTFSENIILVECETRDLCQIREACGDRDCVCLCPHEKTGNISNMIMDYCKRVLLETSDDVYIVSNANFDQYTPALDEICPLFLKNNLIRYHFVRETNGESTFIPHLDIREPVSPPLNFGVPHEDPPQNRSQ